MFADDELIYTATVREGLLSRSQISTIDVAAYSLERKILERKMF